MAFWQAGSGQHILCRSQVQLDLHNVYAALPGTERTYENGKFTCKLGTDKSPTARNLILELYIFVSNLPKSVKLLAFINCLVFCWVKPPLHG